MGLTSKFSGRAKCIFTAKKRFHTHNDYFYNLGHVQACYITSKWSKSTFWTKPTVVHATTCSTFAFFCQLCTHSEIRIKLVLHSTTNVAIVATTKLFPIIWHGIETNLYLGVLVQALVCEKMAPFAKNVLKRSIFERENLFHNFSFPIMYGC